MTDNEIIKALECCADNTEEKCRECPFHKLKISCIYGLERNAIDLINRQKAEIENRDERELYLFRKIHERDSEIDRLQSVNADVQESLRLAAEANKDMQAEVKKLKADVKRLTSENENLTTSREEQK